LTLYACDQPETCTDREREILRVIQTETQTHGYPPSVRELCELLHVASTNGMIEHLQRLTRKGYLQREIATARAISVTEKGKAEISK
jgi:repressor LexA